MKQFLFLLFFFTIVNTYTQQIENDSISEYIRISGDTIVKGSIGLNEVLLLPKRPFYNSDQIRNDKEYWLDEEEYFKSLNGKFMTLRLVEQVSNNQMKLENLKVNGLKAAPQGPVKIKNDNLLRHIEIYFTDNYQTDFFPDIVEENKTLYEGAKKAIVVNKYERSSKARENAVNFHGVNCKVCDINFKEMYGEIGTDFIHIHHLIPIHEIGENYRIDYKHDLIPVCPNCHSMLHRKLNGKELSVEELKDIITKCKTLA